MIAASLHAPGDLRVEELPRPVPEALHVLLRVGACGVCGSDIPRILVSGTYHHPTIPGHEFMGEVVELGEGVSSELAGRRAAVIPLIGCGACAMCRAGLPFHCGSYDFLGSRSDGGFAEYAVAPVSNLVFLDDRVTDASGALLEPIAVGLHAIRRPGIEAGDTAVVFGAGAIGLFAAQWARHLGAGQVIQVDIRPEALTRAEACGAHVVVNGLTEDVEKRVLELTNGRGADLAVEAAGAAASTAQAFRCVRRRGRISLIGRIDGDWTMPEDVLTGLMRKEQTVFGNWGFDAYSFPANDWDVAARGLGAGAITTEPLISHRFPLKRIGAAIDLMAARDEYFCKVMIEM